MTRRQFKKEENVLSLDFQKHKYGVPVNEQLVGISIVFKKLFIFTV